MSKAIVSMVQQTDAGLSCSSRKDAGVSEQLFLDVIRCFWVFFRAARGSGRSK